MISWFECDKETKEGTEKRLNELNIVYRIKYIDDNKYRFVLRKCQSNTDIYNRLYKENLKLIK